jgi:class 3 adenylate cyclase
MSSALRRAGERVALLGVDATDSEPLRVQKVTLTLAAITVTVLSIVWVATYLALGLPVSAAIPFTYQVVTLATLAMFARSKDIGSFRVTQLLLMLILPFLLQWSLGGYVASSAVSLWALVAAFGALFFLGDRAGIPWFAAFLALTVVSGLAEPLLARDAAALPSDLVTAFFVLNIIGVSITAYLFLQYAIRARDAALDRSERLLLNVLPEPIARRLKQDERVIADRHEDVTVLFADVVDFTPFSEHRRPEDVVALLDDLFVAFDGLAERFGLEKIKTIGDAYMAVAGAPTGRVDHAQAAAEMALAMQDTLGQVCRRSGVSLQIRIGLDAGPVVAGVIGQRRSIYDLWGDTVNTASRMESSGLPGRIQVTERVYERLRDAYEFEPRGEVEVKGKGLMPAYLLIGPRSGAGGTQA